MPKRLMADCIAALNDPDRLAMMEELALIDALIGDALGRVESGESGELCAQMGKAAREFRAARRVGDGARVVAATTTLVELAIRGLDDRAAWQDIMELIERRRRLVVAESRRQREAREVIPNEQALALMNLLIEAVRRHVTDADALRAVVEEFSRLTGRPIPTRAPRR